MDQAPPVEQTAEEKPKIGLYFLDVATPPACFAQTQSSLTTVENVDIRAKISMDDILFQIKSGNKCLLVLTVAERNDLALIANGLFSIKKEIRDRKVMAVVFMKFASDKVEDLLQRSGCSETLRFDVSAKAFTYKVRRFLKLLEQEEAVESITELHGGGKSDGDGGKSVGGSGRNSNLFQVIPTEAWQGKDDFWLFRKKIYAKKYQGKWLIEIIGPSPSAGSWTKLEGDRWQWSARPGFDFFDPTPGVWEFTGKEPQYSWVINRWGFVSENPSLTLLQGGKLMYSRFHLRDANTLEVPNNSDFARSIFQQIKDTYDKDYHYRDEKKNLSDLQGTIPLDAEIPWADKTNSKDLSASDWNIHDLTTEPTREYGEGEITDFLMGAEAMQDCGLTGKIKNYDVELLEYNEAQATITVGVDGGLVEYKEMLEVTVIAENLGLPQGIKLKGVVSSVEADPESTKSVAVVLMLQSSKEEFRKIRDAVDKRQREIFAFFKKTKGLE
jgi:hypothetical protein